MKPIRSHLAGTIPVAVLTVSLLAPAAVLAQSRGLFGDLFNRGQPQSQQQAAPPSRVAQTQNVAGNGEDIGSRIDRIESALRQLTGTVEELQHQNQMMQMELRRLQGNTGYRYQQQGSRGVAPAAPSVTQPSQMPPSPTQAPPMAPGQRSDAFNPARHPNAPGVPHELGNPSAAVPQQQQPIANQAPAAQPAGTPLNLSSLAGNRPVTPPGGGVPNPEPMGAVPQQTPPTQMAPAGTVQAPQHARQNGQLPPPPPRDTSATGVKLATLPPSASPKDEYDLAYGYVLHRDYGLAEQAFSDFLRKYPNQRMTPEAQYWLGESLFQQKQYRDAAKAFLTVSTKYEHSGKAPEALLRLGQSLAAMHQKEDACATYREVRHKYPHAAASLKRGVAREEKRIHC
jgi:tol-pal system protein YbgF